MHTRSIGMKWRIASGAAVLALLLVACSKVPEPVKPPTPSPEPSPAPATPVPQVSTPAPTASTAIVAPPKASRHDAQPALSSMALARTNSKMGVPVDLRYQFDGDALNGQAVTLHLAAVPRIAVNNLAVSIKPVAGITTSAGELHAQKASAGTGYRQQLSVTRNAQGPTELRVLVTTDLPEGKAFSYFSVPLAAKVASKNAPVKMR